MKIKIEKNVFWQGKCLKVKECFEKGNVWMFWKNGDWLEKCKWMQKMMKWKLEKFENECWDC